MSEKSLHNPQGIAKKGIQPFPESPSEERSNRSGSVKVTPHQEDARSITAVELFSLFTADVIRENLEFRR
jgi:hypothetical protein